MAQKIQVVLTDDLSGGPADETVTFSIDGRFFEIDLSAENAATLRAFLAPFEQNGRRAGTDNLAARSADTQHAKRQENSRVREWAERHGFQLSPAGRIPQATRDAYDAYQRGDRTRLHKLMKDAGVDPETIDDSTTNVLPIHTPKAQIAEHIAAKVKKVGKLSGPQENKLRAAVASSDGTGKAKNHTELTTYRALVARGLMCDIGNDDYRVTEVGRAWVKLNPEQISA